MVCQNSGGEAPGTKKLLLVQSSQVLLLLSMRLRQPQLRRRLTFAR